MTPILGLIAFVVWIYILRVIHKGQLPAWEFVWGSCGIFVFMILFIRPYCTQPLAQTVAAIAGCFGKITGMFTSYFKYGVIFVNSDAGAITLQIDFECSGILEIMAYLSLLLFFRAYTKYERGILSVLGTAYIILANALRIIAICVIIHYFGMYAYYVAHTFIGRILFYGLSILLYFFVFTKTQIIRQKVGGFSYGMDK